MATGRVASWSLASFQTFLTGTCVVAALCVLVSVVSVPSVALLVSS